MTRYGATGRRARRVTDDSRRDRLRALQSALAPLEVRQPSPPPRPGSMTRWGMDRGVQEGRRAGRSEASPYPRPAQPGNAEPLSPLAARKGRPRREALPLPSGGPRRSAPDSNGCDLALRGVSDRRLRRVARRAANLVAATGRGGPSLPPPSFALEDAAPSTSSPDAQAGWLPRIDQPSRATRHGSPHSLR